MKLIIKNKRGEGQLLGEETVKLIFSLMSVAVLLLLAGGLFFMFVDSTEVKQADATLEEIIRVAGALDDGEIGKVLIVGPSGWYFMGRGRELCICEDDDVENCGGSVAGVCEEMKKEVKILEVRETLSFETLPYYRVGTIEEILISVEENLINLNFKPSRLTGEDKELYDNFLDSKSIFLDKGELTIEEQFRVYYNAKSIPVRRKNSDEKKELEKNIQNYFKDYPYPIRLYMINGEGYSGSRSTLPVLDEFDAGIDGDVDRDNLPEWPTLIIENPDGAYVKNFIIRTGLRN
jgi:hypothetical protein